MKYSVGTKLIVNWGDDLGLDVTKGEVEVLSINNSNSNSIQEAVNNFMEPIFVDFSIYLKGKWVTFKYIDKGLNELYGEVTIPEMYFKNLIL